MGHLLLSRNGLDLDSDKPGCRHIIGCQRPVALGGSTTVKARRIHGCGRFQVGIIGGDCLDFVGPRSEFGVQGVVGRSSKSGKFRHG